MIEENKHMEQLFREKFSDYIVQPSAGLWNRIHTKLFFREFFMFDLSSFNVYYLSAILGVAITGIALFTGPDETKIAELPETTLGQSETTVPERTTTSDQSYKSVEKEVTESLETIVKETSISETKSMEESEAIAETPEVVRKDSETAPTQLETTLPEGVPAAEQDKETPKLSLKPPVADYSLSAREGCGMLAVQFENSSLYADSYLWQFGDGGTSEEDSPAYIYDEPGEYVVQLEVTGAGGKTVIAKDTILVFALPEAIFEIRPEDAVIPDDPVTFRNYSKNAVRYRWDFGDNHTSTEMDPTHYYVTAGSYDVRLDVWSEKGCYDSLVIRDAFAGSECMIVFPNAFAPNPNGPSNGYYTEGPTSNEVFHPVCFGVVEYQLRIFNRFGALVFESNDVNIGWDGYIKGALAKQDVYVWKVRGKFENGKTFMEHGNVTLIVKK